jgi:hypothetical protein
VSRLDSLCRCPSRGAIVLPPDTVGVLLPPGDRLGCGVVERNISSVKES